MSDGVRRKLRLLWNRLFLAFMAMWLGVSTAGHAESEQEITLVFGVYTADKPTETILKFKPMIDYLEVSLSKRLGLPVQIRYNISPDYDEGIRRLVAGEVDFSRFGPASYVIASEQNPEIDILAMELVDGRKSFEGYIITHQDSDINRLEDLTGRTFAFGDQLSTIGRYLSQLELMDSGIFAKDLAHFEYLERHDRVGYAVSDRSFDAGALKASTFESLVKDGHLLRIITRFDNVTKPWVASADLTAPIKTAIQESFLELTDAKLLNEYEVTGFISGTIEDYQRIRDAIVQSVNFSQ